MDWDLMMSTNSLLTLSLLLLLAPFGLSAEQSLRDPTRPYAYQEIQPVVEIPEEVMQWHVSAVRIGAHNRSAIVNGTLVHVGERFGQARVVAIEADAVVLDYQGKPVRVGLLRPVIKRLAAAGYDKPADGGGDKDK